MSKKIFVSVIPMISALCQGDLPRLSRTISAVDLAIQYKQSKAGVRSKYEDKEITVQGYALFEASMPGTDEYEGLIALEGKEDGDDSSPILCWFNGKEAAEFSKIRSDQYITVKGIFNGERRAELKFCKLVEVD